MSLRELGEREALTAYTTPASCLCSGSLGSDGLGSFAKQWRRGAARLGCHVHLVAGLAEPGS